MDSLTIKTLGEIAKKKWGLLEYSFARYFVYAMMAGMFCTLGIILSFTAASSLNAYEATKGLGGIAFGVTFALALILIVFCGSELFTGNVMVMSVAVMDKQTKLSKAVKLLVVCYIANFVGATLSALLIGQTGLLSAEILGEYLVQKTAIKMNLSFMQALTRGIFCNMLVCLAIWCTAKMKSETAKIMVIFWCVFAFCTSGFEHSIANMALFVMAMISPYSAQGVSLAGYISNMIPVTIGNIIGGAVVVAGGYFFVSSKIKTHEKQITL